MPTFLQSALRLPAARSATMLTAALAVLFLVGFEQGALTEGQPLLHELFHDARHLLGLPCH